MADRAEGELRDLGNGNNPNLENVEFKMKDFKKSTHLK